MNHDELYKALCKVPSGKEKSRDRIIIELYMRSQGASQKQLVDALNMRPATVSEQIYLLNWDMLLNILIIWTNVYL